MRMIMEAEFFERGPKFKLAKNEKVDYNRQFQHVHKQHR